MRILVCCLLIDTFWLISTFPSRNGDGLDDVVYINGWGTSEERDINLNPGNGFEDALNIKGPIFDVGSTIDTAEKDLARFR